MPWWKFWEGGRGEGTPDYYEEGVALTRAERYHEALTSFRLALRERPDDAATIEQMAVVYTRIGLIDEAIKSYRRALELGPDRPAPHYGLAFLLLRRGEERAAERHLRSFLESSRSGQTPARNVEHARATLERLESREVTDGAVDG